MLAISQAHHTLNYLQWVPSENGPLINGYGSLVSQDFDFQSGTSFAQLISAVKSEIKLDIPVFALSLDTEQVFFTDTPIESSAKDSSVLSWQAGQSQDSRFPEVYDSYHYFMHKSAGMYLNVHFPKAIRNAVSEAMKQHKAEIRAISVGIFSAENCARYCFKADQHDTYLIWRMGKYSSDQLLLVENGALRSYFTIKRHNDTVKLLSVHGDGASAEEIREEIENYIRGKLTGFNSVDHVYAYQADGKYLDIRKLMESALVNVSLLNPLKIASQEHHAKINYFKTSFLAETGMIFRGVDV